MDVYETRDEYVECFRALARAGLDELFVPAPPPGLAGGRLESFAIVDKEVSVVAETRFSFRGHRFRYERQIWPPEDGEERPLVAFTHMYKRRIGPWGLVARVTLDVQPVDEPPREARRIDDARVWWLPPQGIVLADEKWMAFGLGLVAGQLEALRGRAEAVLVRVEDWDVPMLTDYQEEVAAAAVIECLRQNYGISGVDIGLTYDRGPDRYRFTWNGAQAEPGAGVIRSSYGKGRGGE